MVAFKSWLWCAVLWTAGVAFAQAPRPSVMPFPLEFKRSPSGFGKDDKEAMQREYQRLLKLAGALVPEHARYELALKELKRQDCEREDECLVQLAKKAESLYGLYASVDYTVEGAVVVSGRVVRDDGKVVSPTETVKLAKGKDPFKDIAKNALVQLFAQLKVGALPAERQVETPKTDTPKTDTPKVENPKVENPPPPPPPLVIEDTGAGQRNAGKAMTYVGAGVAIVGAGLAVAGAGMGYGLGLSDANVPPASLETIRTARTLTTVGFVGLGVGALTAGIGAVLWGTAAPPPVTQVTVVPTAGGGVVQLGGTF